MITSSSQVDQITLMQPSCSKMMMDEVVEDDDGNEHDCEDDDNYG